MKWSKLSFKMNLESKQFLEKFEQVKVLVVGDLMLDRYWWGNVTRISPEAPVPVVSLQKTTSVVGGAANVAANIQGLGATPYVVGIIGDDDEGKILKETLADSDISAEFLFSVKDRPTTVKTRIVAQHQQIVRIDQESDQRLSAADEEQVWSIINNLLLDADIVIISDYNKGLLSETLVQRLITKANKENKKVLVDPKGKNYQKYKNATLLTPNKKEALEAADKDTVTDAGQKLLTELSLKALLVTQGEDGMTIFEKENKETHLEAMARHVYDVTGAGDTVIATLAVALGAGCDLVTGAKIANAAAGFVVEEVGTTTISFEKLSEAVLF